MGLFSSNCGGEFCVVVQRGCSSKTYPVDGPIGPDESQEQLLARVFGPETLQNSSKIYEEWSSHCYIDADVTYEARGYAVLLSLYGIPTTIGGLALVMRDYESIPGKVLAMGWGTLC